ncbi:MAG: secondary thiamine-phosphate synthase enzyme YjbQ [Candidatus Omnitrophica bacterium]|nr:secondary thiamine-phosphate synthase enzyme YjbQ [Candidatus Omnitrophota bacterium]MDD5429253.1 secondary thiamine-phosphate synthase enzyme YjbQ [Candidatus Omnitrophota bacterium]
MKTYTEYLTFSTKKKVEFINITERISSVVKKSGIKDGICLINAMHITASVFVNDEEPGLKNDFKAWLAKLVPGPLETYHHNLSGEDNAQAHLMRTIMGREVLVAITAGSLDLGPWEQIFYGEFDGCRPKRVLIKVCG